MAKQLHSKRSEGKKSAAKIIAMHEDEDRQDVEQTILQQAEAAEKNSDLELAEKLYKRQMNEKAFNAFVYTRLMIIYRKQKQYKEELEIMNKGLQYFKAHQAKQITQKASNAVIKKLSNSLNKSLGLTDKKGNFLYEPEPIPTWKKRKATVEKKLKAL